MYSETKVVICAEADPLLAALAELPASLESLSSEVPFDLPQLASELVHIEIDRVTAAGTTELRVRFQPSVRFLGLLAAVRARNADGCVV